jgi:hypothetical protein
MRKINAIILAVIYSILSTGIVVTLHYCHNHFSDFKVYGTFDSGCCESECGISNDCCTFDTISGKITQEHVSADNNKSHSPKEILVMHFTLEPDLVEEASVPVCSIIFDSSPPDDIPILNCSLTFYG